MGSGCGGGAGARRARRLGGLGPLPGGLFLWVEGSGRAEGSPEPNLGGHGLLTVARGRGTCPQLSAPVCHHPQVLLADGDQLGAPAALGAHEDEQLAAGAAAAAEDAAAHEVHPRPRVSLSPRPPRKHSTSGPSTSSPGETRTHSHTPCTRRTPPDPTHKRKDAQTLALTQTVSLKGPTRPTTRTDVSGHGASGPRLCLLHCAPGPLNLFSPGLTGWAAASPVEGFVTSGPLRAFRPCGQVLVWGAGGGG